MQVRGKSCYLQIEPGLCLNIPVFVKHKWDCGPAVGSVIQVVQMFKRGSAKRSLCYSDKAISALRGEWIATKYQYILEMLKPLNFSARPGPWFIFPARPVIKIFILGQFGPVGPVWASENILSSIVYNKTTNYLALTDLQRRRLDFGLREEHTAKIYSTETLKNFIYKLA